MNPGLCKPWTAAWHPETKIMSKSIGNLTFLPHTFSSNAGAYPLLSSVCYAEAASTSQAPVEAAAEEDLVQDEVSICVT